MLRDAKVPKKYQPVFEKAQELVGRYFEDRQEKASEGTIEISGERYLLIRAASMSVDFISTVKELYKDAGEEEALNVARSLLFDIAHTIGRNDAKNFHKKMKLKDPTEKLSAGPIHFAHTGWAFVDIHPESRPRTDDRCYLVYDHPYSFESDAWIRSGKKSDCPVCIMNAGYSSGWCEESFGVALVASEIMCKARGDKVCRFIMAHPSRIEGYIKKYLKKKPRLAKRITEYEIPRFFQRKQAELSLRESEERYRKLFEYSNDAIFIHHTNGKIVDVNESACKMMGYNKDQLVKMSVQDLHPKESWESSKKAVRHVKQTGAVRFESTFTTSKGYQFDVDISARIVDQEKDLVQGIVRDITQRKNAERALRESEEELRLVFENAHDAIFWADPSTGLIVNCNKAAEKLLERKKSEMIGFSQSDLHPPGEGKRYKRIFKEHIANKGAVNVEADVYTRSGKSIPVTITASVTKVGNRAIIQGIFHDISDRIRAERALSESERKYRTIFDTSPEAIMLVDTEGHIMDINKRVYDILGLDKKSIVGKRLFEMPTLTKESKVKAIDAAEKRLQGKEVAPYELEFVAHDGTKRIGMIRACPLLDMTGTVLSDLIMISDITEHKLADEALKKAYDELEVRVEERTEELKKSQHLYETLAETAEDYIFIIDRDMKIRYLNRYASRAHGRSPNEMVGMGVTKVFPQPMSERMVENLNDVLKKRHTMEVEDEVVFPSGSQWLHTHLVPLIDEGGHVEAVMGLSRDFSERRKAEEALRESEARYRSLFEDSPISLWEEDFSEVVKLIDSLRESGVTDFREYFDRHPETIDECVKRVKILDINRATIEMYGFENKQNLISLSTSVLTPESFKVFEAGMVALAYGDRYFASESVNKKEDGTRMDIYTRWSVAPGREKDWSKVLVSVLDITEQKRLENEIRQALKVKSNFMSTMSHELRTPLSHIISCADLVMTDKTLNLPEKRINNLNDVLKSSDKLLRMINNILDMARIEAGKVPIITGQFKLKDLVEACIEICKPHIGEKDLKITAHVDSTMPILFTDQDKLGHILNNLIGNAVKFSDYGEISITARMHGSIENTFIIEVKDQGVGIPQDKLDVIFEQFQQVDGSSTRRYEGMGLGLTIVKAYAKLLGGTVSVKSELGKGSVFTVLLPVEISTDISASEGEFI